MGTLTDEITHLAMLYATVEQTRRATRARSATRPLDIAILLPCYNEGLAIHGVIERFRAAIPDAKIYVYDNNSNDLSVEIARRSGAIVRREPRQGKGFVVRRMFADVEADVYIICDADGTYDASVAADFVDELVDEGFDMIVGRRMDISGAAYRPAHKFGNWLLTSLVRTMFGGDFSDMLSGYRVLSRRFVKSFPLMSQGFEIETELTIHALQLEMPAIEMQTSFKNRIAGSESKLQTVSDGFRILWTIISLLKQERPLFLFGLAGLALAGLSLLFGYPVIADYMKSGMVPRLPTAILATGTMILAFLSLFCGLILDTVTRGRQEAKRLRYLDFASVHASLETRETKAD